MAGRRKRKRRDFEALGAVLGRERELKDLVEEGASPIPARIWESVVGTRIAARTRPLRLERGVLLVVTATAAWSSELSLLALPILAKLRAARIGVTDLRFRVGAIEAPVRAPRRPSKRSPPLAPLDEPLGRALDNVPDEDLRRAIELAARRALGFSE